MMFSRSPEFCNVVIRVFDKRGARNINFDDFIQSCVMLKTLTEKFRAKDLQQNGTIRISYEEVRCHQPIALYAIYTGGCLMICKMM